MLFKVKLRVCVTLLCGLLPVTFLNAGTVAPAHYSIGVTGSTVDITYDELSTRNSYIDANSTDNLKLSFYGEGAYPLTENTGLIFRGDLLYTDQNYVRNHSGRNNNASAGELENSTLRMNSIALQGGMYLRDPQHYKLAASVIVGQGLGTYEQHKLTTGDNSYDVSIFTYGLDAQAAFFYKRFDFGLSLTQLYSDVKDQTQIPDRALFFPEDSALTTLLYSNWFIAANHKLSAYSDFGLFDAEGTKIGLKFEFQPRFLSNFASLALNTYNLNYKGDTLKSDQQSLTVEVRFFFDTTLTLKQRNRQYW